MSQSTLPTTAPWLLLDLHHDDEPTAVSSPFPSPTRALFPPRSRLNPLTEPEKQLHDILAWTCLEPLRPTDIDAILGVVYASTPNKYRKLVGLIPNNNNSMDEEEKDVYADTHADLLEHLNTALVARRCDLTAHSSSSSDADRAVRELSIALIWSARDIALATRTESLPPASQFRWFVLQVPHIMARFKAMDHVAWEKWCFVRARRQEKYRWDLETGVAWHVNAGLGKMWEERDLGGYGKVWEEV
ncbi:MAG: hypothetical protein Q9181_003340 [Wetmoreana brouardii]